MAETNWEESKMRTPNLLLNLHLSMNNAARSAVWKVSLLLLCWRCSFVFPANRCGPAVPGL